MKTYLGLDLGTKTLGMAISQTGIIANNLATIRFEEHDYEQALEQLSAVIISYGIHTVVLGYPKHMNNDVGEKGKMAEDFKAMIEEKHPIEVILWDERLSTKSALRALSDQNKKGKKQKALKDEVAAVFILQNYLDRLGGSLR